MAGQNLNLPDALETCNPEDLRRFQGIYDGQLQRGPPSAKAQEDFACYLVRSSGRNEINQGIQLLEDLYHKTVDDSVRSECLFFISIGYTRLKEYEKALRYCTAILKVEPHNLNALHLRDIIEMSMKKDALIGMAVVGGMAALIIGGIIGLTVGRSSR